MTGGRRKLDQRSPKSETPSRERERFGTGMGKKSSSTSQLSATGNTTSGKYYFIKYSLLPQSTSHYHKKKKKIKNQNPQVKKTRFFSGYTSMNQKKIICQKFQNAEIFDKQN